MPNVEEVFDAGGYPEHTYVERQRDQLEDKLIRVLRSPVSGASLIGPSKTGKTVLVKRIAEKYDYDLIQIRAKRFDSIPGLWNTVLDELQVPDSIEDHETETEEDGTQTTGSAKVSGTGVDRTSVTKDVESEGTVETHSRRGLQDIIDVVDSDTFLLLIDDFHYHDEDFQKEISYAIKGAIEDGLSICVALVGYKKERLQELNPDLENRMMSIPFKNWKEDELRKIAHKGEEALSIEFPEEVVSKFVEESIGSPMIMQRLCQSACQVHGVWEDQSSPTQLEFGDDELERTFRFSVDWMNKETVVESMKSGVVSSGRKKYDYGGEEPGDIYILGLRAIANGPATRAFHFDDLKTRIREDCVGEFPNATQIENFCDQMQKIAERERPEITMVEWDSDERVLNIPDPKLLFQIRYELSE